MKHVVKRNAVLGACMAVMALTSCSDTYVNVNIDHDCGGSDTINQGEKYEVAFTGAVNALATKGTSALQANRNVSVVAFNLKSDVPILKSYFTETEGVLSPVRNIPLSVLPGMYDFYAYAIGNGASPLPLVETDNGRVAKISNGVDYLCANLTNETINGPASYNLLFNHVCAQVIVNVAASEATLVVDSILSASIQQPDASSTFLSLYSGNVISTPVLAADSLPMNVNKLSCNQIMVPVTRTDSLAMRFSVFLNGELNSRSYALKVPLPDGKLLGGSSYTFLVNIAEETVSFVDASVNDWTEVDETGRPITPTPVN